MPLRKGIVSLALFFIISDQYSRQGWAFFALFDHCKIHHSDHLDQSSDIALGTPLNFKNIFEYALLILYLRLSLV